MENKINVAELLRDCPRGMELDCTMWNGVEFMEVDTKSDTIILRVGNKFTRRLNKYGQDDNNDYAKCVIFPKDKTTWEGFVPPYKFKDGDVVVDDTGAIFLYSQIHSHYEEPYADFYCGLTSELRTFIIKTAENQRGGKITSIRFATEEEKAELFQAIKDKGYKWNEETKTLEKLIFKVGDRIILKDNPHNMPSIRIKAVTKSHYILENGGFIYMDSANEKYALEDKFDITTLKPFDKVLVRDSNEGTWRPSFWGYYEKCSCYAYDTVRGFYNQCIPYEGNEHLLGTTNDCDEYFKTWKK